MEHRGKSKPLAGHGQEIAKKLFLLCGLVSSLIYVATDILSAISYEGYSYTSQTVSDIAALDGYSVCQFFAV